MCSETNSVFLSPTSICGCGSGESGCSACGCCKACARELDGQEARQRGIFDAVKEMIPLDLLLGTLTGRLTHWLDFFFSFCSHSGSELVLSCLEHLLFTLCHTLLLFTFGSCLILEWLLSRWLVMNEFRVLRISVSHWGCND